MVSYGELDCMSDDVAGALCASDVGKGDIVPILLPRSIETIAALLGALKSGAAACVIGTDYPAICSASCSR